MVRKNADDLSDWVDRAAKFYAGMRVQIAYRPPVIRFPWGAIIRTGHLKDDQAYTKYQGHEYPRLLIEELTQIPDVKRYLQLTASCRSTVRGLKPQIFLTTNPGGVGHMWVKERFVDPAPPETIFEDEISGRTRIYIPATVDDNYMLKELDPDYVRSLDALQLVDEELYKAWRLGSWDVFAGQFFREVNPLLHFANEFFPNRDLPRYAGADWGYSPRPFCFISGALQKVSFNGGHFNRLWVYDEVVGTEKTPAEWAKHIKTKHDLSLYRDLKIDPATRIKQDDGSESILDQFQDNGVPFTAANNDRINGWVAIRKWLSIAPDGLPYMIISKSCEKLIRSLLSVVHDDDRPEDLDTDGDDDPIDGLRYMIIHLKWIDAASLISREKEPSRGLEADTKRMDLSDFSSTSTDELREVI